MIAPKQSVYRYNVSIDISLTYVPFNSVCNTAISQLVCLLSDTVEFKQFQVEMKKQFSIHFVLIPDYIYKYTMGLAVYIV